MHKSKRFTTKIFVFLFLVTPTILLSQTDQPPTITAEGRQAYCIGSPIKIVTDFTITDPDDNSIASFFIQISSGYQAGYDLLELEGSHQFINSSWDQTEGKLTISSAITNGEIPLTNLENAVKDVVFTTSANASGVTITANKTFSLSIGDANYLPLTDHFYEFVSQSGITWKDAKIAAENRTYFGRQGYLATLTNQIEADFAGKQASGAGWIGGSDEETEGVWKWMTGPEAGTTFWNGAGNGSSPNGEFANWHTSGNEPNNFGGNEHYAHITHPNLGVPGKWNDLPNVSGVEPTNDYYPQGYIVEYGVPTDPPLNIVATSSIFIPQIVETRDATICESDNATIFARASEGEILWHDNPNPGTQPELARGNTLTVENVTKTTIYYATITIDGCITLPRIPVTINVIDKPRIISRTNDLICSGTATLQAQASSGQVYWYDTETSITPIFIGNTFETPPLTESKSYYVEANNSNCTPSARLEVTAEIDNTIPQFDIVQDTLTLCADVGSIDLETTNAQGEYSYIWRKEDQVLTGSTAILTVSTSGNYSVIGVSKSGCESTPQNIRVIASEKATITKEDVIITDDSENNSIEIINSNLGIGNYTFSIDDEFGIYQRTTLFENLSTGIHTLYIKDLNGCDTTRFVFSILAYPNFFTPNNDSINDVWNILGFDSTLFSSSKISIYNRFGQLIYEIDDNSPGWDGRYQGKFLPSNTYWFKAILTDNNGLSTEKIGNFSLIR